MSEFAPYVKALEASELRERVLREQLIAAQAREAKLREAIADDSFAITFQSMGQYRNALLKLSIPTDDTALKERLKDAQVKVLREAAEMIRCKRKVGDVFLAEAELRRLADEMEKADAIRGLA